MASLPRIVPLLVMVAFVSAANRYAPGTLQLVLLLIGLYLVLTYADKVAAVITGKTDALAAGLGAASGGGSGGGGPKYQR